MTQPGGSDIRALIAGQWRSLHFDLEPERMITLLAVPGFPGFLRCEMEGEEVHVRSEHIAAWLWERDDA